MDKSAWKNILMFHGHGTENRVSKQTKHFFRPQIIFSKPFSNFGGYMCSRCLAANNFDFGPITNYHVITFNQNATERRVAVSSHTVKNAKVLGALAEFVDKRGLNARLYAEEIKGHVEDDPRVAYHALSSKEQQRLSVMYLRALSCHERTELILRPLFEAKILRDAIWPSDLSIFLCDPMLVDRVMDYVMAEESKGWRDCLLHWAMTLAQNCEDAVQTDLEVEKWEQMEPDSSLDPERLLFDRHEAEAINRGSR